jgi:hypothetical protein
MPGKLDIIMSVMSQLKYAAVGVGNADARLGGEFLSKAEKNKLTVVDTSLGEDKRAVPFVIKDVGGVKVGIISFGVAMAGSKTNEYALRKARFEIFKDVRSKCDVLILLDQANAATDDWLTRNAARLGSPDIIIGGPDRQKLTAEQVVGKTHVMPSLFQAKEIGVIDVELTPGQAPTVKAQRIMMDETFAEDQQIAKQVGQGILAIGGNPVPSPVSNQPGMTANAGGVGNTNGFDAKPYYSPMLCKACHQKEYEDWALTKHSKALKTLVDSKNMTPDCLPCHSELYRDTRNSMALNNLVAGVECATCHKDALPHGLERKDMAVRSKVDPKLCLECHTKERSPTYDAKTYFPQIVHAGIAPTTTAAKPLPIK